VEGCGKAQAREESETGGQTGGEEVTDERRVSATQCK
jgi:hypothetical protein